MRRPFLPALVWMAVAAPSAFAGPADRSEAIYPAQQIALSFAHRDHLEGGANCLGCHPVDLSEKATDRTLPAEAVCTTCHDVERARRGEPSDPPAACDVCHPGFDPTARKAPPRSSFPVANLRFSHKAHLDRGAPCRDCHGEVDAAGLATADHLPKMETCLACHDGARAPAACATCHLAEPGGRLTTRFQVGRAELKPAAGNPFGLAHTAAYERAHATRAAARPELCAQCHSTSACLACHDGASKPLAVHPNDFAAIHPAAARTDTPRCSSCHRRQSFCAPCHERSGVGHDADASLKARNLRVHPDPSIWVLARGPGHHGVAASRDILGCTSCHREETCTACHGERRSGSYGISGMSPHPAGFAKRCRAMASRNDRGCLKCHTASALERLGCR